MKQFITFMSLGALLLVSCNAPKKEAIADKASNEKNVKIEFTGTDNVIPKNAKLKVSLYGLQSNMADVPASLITEKEYTQEKIPFTIDLPVPNNPESLIKPEVKKGDPLKYYVTISWDSNGNGVEDKGDIVIDYDKKFPTIDINENVQQIFLKVSK
ncbi:hypothetical protein CEY12_17120 [Chryseobacterium sp. T16E-39]|uniref:hypothetical protein n=1 Tax=Chryseobacterium sp. T16E-39 TaxID=2015076 RepID=UPI000B5B3132|nr:hypothetical protein [Chryseobacterium sp. T16E-39]ASK31729.1 hypothetical protein CEY12_17120 [Chryseobacterium sp. T16E-39]